MKPLLPFLTGVALVAFQGPTTAQTNESQELSGLRRELEATRRELAELKEMIRSLHDVRRPSPPIEAPSAPELPKAPRRFRALPVPPQGQKEFFRFDGFPSGSEMERHLRESLREHFDGEELERILKSVREHMPKGGVQGFRWKGDEGPRVFHFGTFGGDAEGKDGKKRRAILFQGPEGQGGMEGLRDLGIELEGLGELPGHIEEMLKEHGIHEHGDHRHGHPEIRVFGEGGKFRVIREKEEEEKAAGGTKGKVKIRVIGSDGEENERVLEFGGSAVPERKVERKKDIDVRVETLGGDEKGQVRIHIVGPDGAVEERVLELGSDEKGPRTIRLRGQDGTRDAVKKHGIRIEVDGEGEAEIHEIEGLDRLGETLRLELEPRIERLRDLKIEWQPEIEKLKELEGPIFLELDGEKLRGKIEALKPKLENLRSTLRGLGEKKAEPEKKGGSIYL